MHIKHPVLYENNLRIRELDSLRGIAAISVVLAHLLLSLPIEKNVFRFGVSGVDLFFLISGYVIFMSIEKVKTPADFILARIGRLYPAYWVSVIYTFLLFFCWSSITGTVQKFSIGDLLANLTMFQYYFNKLNIIAPSWTLLIEMLFYIFIIFLCILKQLKKIETIIIICLILNLIYSIILEKYSFKTYLFINHYFPLINHFPLFFSGIIFYRMKVCNINYRRILLVGICFITQISLFNHGGSEKNFMTQSEYIICLLCFYMFFILFAVNKLGFINNVITQFLGKISYSLYLIHLYPSALLIAFFTDTKYFHLNLVVVIVMIVLPFLLVSSYSLFRFIEMPGIKVAKNIRKKI